MTQDRVDSQSLPITHDFLATNCSSSGQENGTSCNLQPKSTGQGETQDLSATSRSPREVPPFHGADPPLRGREHRTDSKKSPSNGSEFIAASRTPPWLPSG